MVSSSKAKAAQPPAFRGFQGLDGASNALLVSDAESTGASPIAVMGPQVGYFSPQILTEIDLHAPTTAEGPAIDARGAAFAGVSIYVLLGRGPDYAWSATSAGQDIIDTYARHLCDPDNPTIRPRSTTTATRSTTRARPSRRSPGPTAGRPAPQDPTPRAARR